VTGQPGTRGGRASRTTRVSSHPPRGDPMHKIHHALFCRSPVPGRRKRIPAVWASSHCRNATRRRELIA